MDTPTLKDKKELHEKLGFATSQRKKVSVSTGDMVTMEYLDTGRRLPLVIRAGPSGRDLTGWMKGNPDVVRSELLRHGAILFRGFGAGEAEYFQMLVQEVSGAAVPYRERTSPRTRVLENVYTSTDYPKDQRILPHNENSYALTFPRKLYFCCAETAEEGGETPLADTRRVLARIDRKIVQSFVDKNWMYVRNFTSHFGLTWETAFQTQNRNEVEEYCRKADIECEWTASGLRTRQVRPALLQHPEAGEMVWFNHATFFHISKVEAGLKARLMGEYDEKDLPNNTYYGDGSPIPVEVVEHMLEAYENELVSFRWEKGDVLVVDNILTAHARAPYKGGRRILVAMADTYTRTDWASN